jgi:hypothetical protein
MTLEELRPDLLREFETCFEAIAQALAKAAEQRSVDPAESVAELLGLKEHWFWYEYNSVFVSILRLWFCLF